jgi:hypothetical protein
MKLASEVSEASEASFFRHTVFMLSRILLVLYIG